MLYQPQVLLWLLLLVVVTPNASTAAAAGKETLIGLTGDGFVLLAADSSCAQGNVLTSSDLDKIAVLPQNVAVAAVGDVADADRLVGGLRMISNLQYYESITQRNYKNGNNDAVVTYVDCSSKDTTAAGNRITSPSGNGLLGDAPAPAADASSNSVHCIAQRARTLIANRLRSSNPLRVCLLVAGMTKKDDHEQQQQPSVSVADHVQRQVQTATASFVTKQAETMPEDSHVSSDSRRSLQQPALYWLDEYGALQRVSYGVHGSAESLLWSVLDRGYRPHMTLPQALNLVRDCLDQLRARYVINTSHPSNNNEKNDNNQPTFCIKCIDEHGCRLLDLTAHSKSAT
jgi:20S proteasome alpha/beta subunit